MDTRQCTSKDDGPRIVVDWGVSHQLKKGTSANEDIEPQMEVDCEIPRQCCRGECFIRVWKPFSSRRVLKT